MHKIIIEAGLIFLLVYTPLAFGGVSPRSIVLVEFISGVMFLIWIVKLLSHRQHFPQTMSLHSQTFHKQPINFSYEYIIYSLLIFFVLQRVPLPKMWLKILSPGTYQLYTQSALLTGLPLPDLLPLSVCPQATETGLYLFLAYIMIFILIIKTIRTPQQVSRLVYTIIIVGLFESFYGLIQFVSGQHQLSFSQAGSWVNGTFVNRNHFAGYMEMVIPLAFGVLFTRFEGGNSSRKRSLKHIPEETYAKAFFVLSVLFIMISSLILSGSRGGIISFSFGMLFFALCVHSRRLLRKWIIIVLIFLPLVIGIVMLMNPDLIGERLQTLKQLEEDSSFRVRWELWKSATHIFQDFPLTGSGLGTFSHLARRYRTFRGDVRFNYPENDYLQLLSETGIIGTVFILLIGGVFFFHIFTTWKQRRSRWVVAMAAGQLSAIICLLIHSVADFNLHIPSNALMFTVIAALSYVTVHMPHTPGDRRRKAEGRKQKIEGRRQKGQGGKRYVIYAMMISFVFMYLFFTTRSYYAFTHYQRFLIAARKPSDLMQQPDAITGHLEEAIRYDGNNAEYSYALGSYLYEFYEERSQTETTTVITKGLDEAEQWLQKAVMTDPAHPWPYYQLGRISHKRGDCPYWQDPLYTNPEHCPTVRYFSAALKNAPLSIFLRKEIGRWYEQYDPNTAKQIIRGLLTEHARKISATPEIARDIARFLYEMQWDYESDRELEILKKETSGDYTANIVAPNNGNTQRIEFGNDDGSAEWKTALISESDRVKKILCLPDNLEQYTYAALKIFINNGGNRHFTTNIYLDNHLIKTYRRTVPRAENWHEIPFDRKLLEGKPLINVYIRVTEASETGNFLQVWGDQETPTTQSAFNFNITRDLSSDEGVQSGEYLIRLVLKP